MKRKGIVKLTNFDKKSVIIYKSMTCSVCNITVGRVEETVQKYTCHICCAKYGHVPEQKKEQVKKTGFPKGWKFFNIFVHADGRVFEKGVENEKLKGTLEPTKIKESRKLTKRERDAKKEEKDRKELIKYKKKKKMLTNIKRA